MAKINLHNISSGFNLSKINENFQKIEEELQNKVLYRDNPEGEPNQCKSDLDLNNRDLLNVRILTVDGEDIVSVMRTIYENYLSVTQKVTVSTDAPSGGADGDIWFRITT